MRYTIELDCAPGPLRPGDLLPGLLEDTGLVLDEPDSTCFGRWTWVIPPDQAQTYCAVRVRIERRICALYAAGTIRYGSW